MEVILTIKRIPQNYTQILKAANDIAEQLNFRGAVYLTLCESRAELNHAVMQNLECWVKGVTKNNSVFILDYCNQYYDSKEQFERVILHEITHAIVNSMTHNNVPNWLNEGLALILSGEPIQKELEEYLSDENDFYYYEKCFFRTQKLLKDFTVSEVVSSYITN